MRHIYKFGQVRSLKNGLVVLVSIVALNVGARTIAMASGPTINVWYGSPQKFGQMGVPQRWVNILGNIFSGNGVSSFSYTLNAGPSIPLNFLADTRRIVQTGDFNVDIPVQNLNPGTNTVAITVVDNGTLQTTALVDIEWTNGKVWPNPYTVALTSPSALSDSAQVVDGHWVTAASGARIGEVGYDRIIAIGDSSWSNYEIQAKIFVNAVNASDSAFDGVNGGPGVGFLMRWNGHTNDPVFDPPITQPLSGYLPLGALGWFRYLNHNGNGLTNRWELIGNNLVTLDTTSQTPLPSDTLFNMKMRVETVGAQAGNYTFKAWKDGTTEPVSWLLTGSFSSGDPQHGSVLLMAHWVDVTFSDVQVTPIDSIVAPLLITPADNATGVVAGTLLQWHAAANAGSYDLQVSTSPTFSSGFLVDQTGISDTSFTLPPVAGTTVYHWRVRGSNLDGPGPYSTPRQFTVAANPVRVVAKAFLEGPFSSGSGAMSKALRTSGVLATQMPGALIPAEAVDTVTVEIRDSAVASKATLRSSVHAWILSDGTFKLFADTTKAYVEFSGVDAGNYYVVIRHRNHLAIMSSSAVSLSGTSTLYDFTTAQAKAYGTNPMTQLTTGVFGMYGGDANGSGDVSILDRAVWRTQNSLPGYLGADFNLTGDVSILDRAIWRNNNSFASQVP